MHFKLSFIIICIIIIISVGFTAYITLSSNSESIYNHQYQNYYKGINNSNAALPPAQSSKPLQSSTSKQITSPKRPSSSPKASPSSKANYNTNQAVGTNNKLSKSQMDYLNSYYTAYLNKYMKTLSKDMADALLENFDTYIQMYIADYINKNSSSNITSENISSIDISSNHSAGTSNFTSNITSHISSDVTSEDIIPPPPDPPTITDEFIQSEVERLSLKFSITLEINNPDNSDKLSNEEIIICINYLENVLNQLPMGLTGEFDLNNFLITSSSLSSKMSALSTTKNEIVVTRKDDPTTIKFNIHTFFAQEILQSGMSVNLWQYNPPMFDFTGPDHSYTYSIDRPDTSYFVTYKAQSSEIDDLAEIFIEIINNQNRFVRLPETSPLYNKIKLACEELSNIYPAIKATPTVKVYLQL